MICSGHIRESIEKSDNISVLAIHLKEDQVGFNFVNEIADCVRCFLKHRRQPSSACLGVHNLVVLNKPHSVELPF